MMLFCGHGWMTLFFNHDVRCSVAMKLFFNHDVRCSVVMTLQCGHDVVLWP